jgi:7,8-dihydropterin-6-yl-methyl-4-(beta-D-ribofuranosyl)aminobenzene 5'-phosphate synthase
MNMALLSDNRADPGLEAEHGFALWIETGGRRFLFDTGEGTAFVRNARALGIDPTTADAVVLSHGHYDHTGNLAGVLEQAPQTALYAHPDCTRTRYSIREMPKPVGMPLEAAAAVSAMQDNLRYLVTHPMQVVEGVWLTGPVPRVTSFEDTGGPFFLDSEGRSPDLIPDDLSLWIQTTAGLVVCLGCCHAGIINTLRHITAVSGESRIAAVIGGMHLINATDERLERTAEALKAYAIPSMVLCHCTGEPAVAFLAGRLGSCVERGSAGWKRDFN